MPLGTVSVVGPMSVEERGFRLTRLRSMELLKKFVSFLKVEMILVSFQLVIYVVKQLLKKKIRACTKTFSEEERRVFESESTERQLSLYRPPVRNLGCSGNRTCDPQIIEGGFLESEIKNLELRASSYFWRCSTTENIRRDSFCVYLLLEIFYCRIGVLGNKIQFKTSKTFC